MKRNSKKILKQIENKIIDILNKKISICSVMWIIIGLILFSLLFSKKPDYFFIDTNGNIGHSSNCYETSDKLLCEIDTEVKQFYKN